MVSRDKVSLQLRPEIFDHGVYPCPHRLNSKTMQGLVKAMLQCATPDGKISASHWAEVAINHLSISLHEAEVYFETFRTLGYDRKPLQLLVDVRPFAVFISLQMFSASTSRMSLENASSLTSKFNVEFPGLGGTYPSPMTSPRSKGGRGFLMNQTETDYQMAHQFIKSNLRLILKIFSADAAGDLTSADLSLLELVVGSVEVEYPIARLFPGSHGKPPSARFRQDDVFEWLNRKLIPPTPESINTLEGVVTLVGINKAVLVKGDNEWMDKDVRVTNCEGSYIYVNTNVKQILLVGCRETTLFVAGANKVVSVDKCEQCTITVATNLLRVGNSVDCMIYVYSPFAPVLYGDNRGLVIGPFNAFYPELPGIVDRADIPRSFKNPKCLQNWYTPIEMNSERNGHCFTDLLPKDFFKLVLPRMFNAQKPNSQFTPDEFVKALGLKEEYFQAIQKMIANTGLNEEQEKRLHLAIQGHFREWLVSSGHVKGPLELVRMIDQE